MLKNEFKNELENLLNESVLKSKNDYNCLDIDEKVELVKMITRKLEVNEFDQSNTGKTWEVSEIELILSEAPTQDNVIKFAKLFKRSTDAVLLVYRWAATPQNIIDNGKYCDNSHVRKIKEIAKKKLKWVI